MKRFERRRRPRNRHLLVGITMALVLMFGLAILLNTAMVILSHLDQEIDASIKDMNSTGKYISDEMESYEALPWLLDYIKAHSGTMEDQFHTDVPPTEWDREQEKNPTTPVTKKVYEDTWNITVDEISEASEYFKNVYAKQVYHDFQTIFNLMEAVESNLNVDCAVQSGEGQFYVYFSGRSLNAGLSDRSWQSLSTGTDTLMQAGLYYYNGMKGEKPEELYDLAIVPLKKTTDTGVLFRIRTYQPVEFDGKVLAVVCCERAWTVDEVTKNIQAACRVEMMNAAVLGGCGIIVLILLAILIVRPIIRVQQSVLEYSWNKDKDSIVSSMERIRSRNEIGRLADGISEMAVEIDRYSDQLIELHRKADRLDAELGVAAGIQSGILPMNFPAFPDRDEFDIYASMVPAKEVGGDLYDFFLVDADHLAIVIGDVSGKGVPAALFMTITVTLLRNELRDTRQGIGEVLAKVNDRLYDNNENMMFVTLWAGILELSTGRLVSANGGHEWPLIRKQADGGSFRYYEEDNNLVLGISPGVTYSETERILETGDMVYLYTDGLVEAMNGQEEEFGEDRLLEAVNEDSGSELKSLDERVRVKIHEFVGDRDPFDDQTTLCVRYLRS